MRDIENRLITDLKKLQLDLVNYRGAVDNIFSSSLVTSTDWQQCFQEILICAGQLYLDYLLVMKNLSSMNGLSSKNTTKRIRLDMKHETILRKKLKQELESSVCWVSQFKPENPFSELTGLRSREDYADKLTLHLPEIYNESFRVETYTKSFLANLDTSELDQLLVGLQHIGQNHISFVLQALEWMADKDSWGIERA